MFNLPIFVYSKKSPQTHLETFILDANSSFSSSVGVEITNEVIKTKIHYLTENFLTQDFFNSGSDQVQTDNEADWDSGRLECYSEIQQVDLKETSFPTDPTLQNDINTAVANSYALQYTKTLTTKTQNVSVTDALDTLANKVIVGVALQSLNETNDGNTLNGNGSFNNNPVFYPFINKPLGQESRPYGLSNNIVPSGVSVTSIRFHSSTDAAYTADGNLYIGFDLCNLNSCTNNITVQLLDYCEGNHPNDNNNCAKNYKNINAIYAISPTLISDNISLRNVRLKIVDEDDGQTFSTAPYATSLFNLLNLQIEATYTNPLHILSTTQPEITSDIFKLQNSAEPPVAFTGAGSLSFYSVDSTDGIEVRARFSESAIGIKSAEYVYLGTITGQGSGKTTLNLNVENLNPAYEAAKTAKYIQVNLKGVKNTISGIYNQSKLSRLFSVKELDPRKKSFIANSFPDKLKFSQATTVILPDNAVFGAFDLQTDGKEKLFSSGAKATYGRFGYKYGVISSEHTKHNKLTYYAKNSLNNDIETKPSYVPTAEAITMFNNAGSPPSGSTNYLILAYDIIVTQGDNKYQDINAYGSNTNSNSLKSYLDTFFSNKSNSVLSFPHELKTVYIRAASSGSFPGSDNLPTELANRNSAEFLVHNTKIYYNSCSKKRCSNEKIYDEVKARVDAGTCTEWYTYVDGQTFINTTCYEFDYEGFRKDKELEICPCLGEAIPVNNTYFTFGFTNFREVVINYTPSTVANKPGKIKEIISRRYDLTDTQNATNTLTGSWVGNISTKINYIEPQFVTVETPLQTGVPEKIILPPINFDNFPVKSTTIKKDFNSKLLIEFYNGSTKVGDSILKTFTGTSATEITLNAPTNISTATKMVTYIGIEPVGLNVYEYGLPSTAASKLSIIPNRYIVNNENEYNDVGIDFLSKPRLERTDAQIEGYRKKYFLSQVVSKPYDLGYSTPSIKSGVLLDGTTSLPEGTNIKFEWQGSTDGTNWLSAWTENTFDASLNNRYVRFRATLTPDLTFLKSPIIDEIKLKYWEVAEPYVIQSAALNDTGTYAILTDIATKNPNDINNIKVQVSTNNGTDYYPSSGSAIQYEKFTISNSGTDAKVKLSILDESVELENLVVEIIKDA